MTEEPFSVVERQGFMAQIQATIGIDLWRREIVELLRQDLAARWDELPTVGEGKYLVKLRTGHVIVFRIDLDKREIIPLTIGAGG